LGRASEEIREEGSLRKNAKGKKVREPKENDGKIPDFRGRKSSTSQGTAAASRIFTDYERRAREKYGQRDIGILLKSQVGGGTGERLRTSRELKPFDNRESIRVAKTPGKVGREPTSIFASRKTSPGEGLEG